MSHRVIWRPRARTELADAYLLARRLGLSRRVTQAAAQIDTLLKSSPESLGEGRHDSLRVLIVKPLTVDFEVRLDGTVVVHALRLIRPRRR